MSNYVLLLQPAFMHLNASSRISRIFNDQFSTMSRIDSARARSTAKETEMSVFKNVAVAAVAALTIASANVATTQQADARPGGFHGKRFHGGVHRGFHHRGFHNRGLYGPRFGYRLGFGYPYYATSAYGHATCFIKRRVMVDRFGYRYVRPVRVCV
jgi:hypothetical protein